jgi:ribonuclease HI
VPVEKKNMGKIRICVDFRDLNRATPKDEYPMPIADELVNQASGNKIISFLDGNAGYNQIFMAEKDVSKTTFRCPRFVGLFEWVVMTFGLRNAGATYQRSMNLIFHDLLGIVLEIYIDDVVVKSAGKFLGFIVHEHGIEIDPKKVEAIQKLEGSTCKRDVQKLLGKNNYLRRFISNLAGKVESFTPLVRLKHETDFRWGAEQREAFVAIKKYLLTPPVLKASKAGVPFRLYIAAQEMEFGAVLIQEHNGKESVVAYLSHHLLDSESRYAFIEKLCLSLYFARTKFRHYLLLSTCTVVCQMDVIKYMLQKPILSGRVGKWAYALIEYDLIYESLSSMKGQVIVDFITDHRVNVEQEISCLNTCPWQLFFDGYVCKEGPRIDYVLVSPNGLVHETSIMIEYCRTNNQIEYEALLFGLMHLDGTGIKEVHVFGDSLLVVQQVRGEFRCLDGMLRNYLGSCLDIVKKLDTFTIVHISRDKNSRAIFFGTTSIGI